MKNTTTENLPQYWCTEFNKETAKFIDKHYLKSAEQTWESVLDSGDTSKFIGHDGSGMYESGTKARLRSESFINNCKYIPLEEFYKLTGINGKATPKAKPKNLILKKDMPSIFEEGIEYKQKKGTVYYFNGNEWDLVKGIKCAFVCKGEYEANKEWYGMTSKAHTYEIYKVNGDEVKFEEGQIRVGCQTIPNDVVRAIAKNLINNQ